MWALLARLRRSPAVRSALWWTWLWWTIVSALLTAFWIEGRVILEKLP